MPRDPRVRLFLAGQAVTRIGSWATAIAIWGYATFAFDADAGQIALIGLVWAVPALLLGPIIGVPIDRYGPRPVLIVSELVGLLASIALMTTPSFGWVIALSVGHGINRGISFPALDALPPRIVEGEQLASTNALLRMTDDLAIVIGPVVGALSISLFGFAGAFGFDALTYGAGLVTVLPLAIRAVAAEPGGSWGDDLRRGLRLVTGTPVLRRMFTLSGALYLLWGAALLLEPIYVRDVLGQSVTVFAGLQSVFGVVLVGAGIVVARLGDRVADERIVALAVVGSGLGALVYLATPSVVVAFVGVAAWGGATAFFGGPSRTVIQRNAPEQVHGRVLALDGTMQGAADVLAMAFVGVLIDALGVRAAAAVLALAVTAVGARTLAASAGRPRLSPLPSRPGG